MRKYILLSFLMFFTNISYSQWISNYTGNQNKNVLLQNAHGNDVFVDNNGFCYVVGTVNEGSGNDILIIKYKVVDGDTVWVKTYNGADNGDDIGNKGTVDENGNIYVIGAVTNSTRGYDMVLLKYDSGGSLIWDKFYYVNQVNGEDIGVSLAVDGEENIYVTGFCTNTDAKTDVITVKYTAGGDFVWEAREDGPDGLNAKSTCIAVNNNGNSIFVAGYITTYTGNNDIFLVKYTSSGTRAFFKTYNNGFNKEDRAFGIAVDESDNIYITGYVTSNVITGNTDCITRKYNSTGSHIWTQIYSGSAGEEDKAFGIVVDEDRYVYIAGYSRVQSGNNDFLLVAYDPNGNLVYSKTYDGPSGGDDKAKALGLISDQNNNISVVVTGSSWGINNNYDYTTIWFEKLTGTQVQLTRYYMNAQTDDKAMALAIDESNHTFITGYSELLGNGASSMCAVSTLMYNQLEWITLKTAENTPKNYSLKQNYPNPFNPGTLIKFDIGQNSMVSLKIYDVTGKVVSILINEFLSSGSYEITFTTGNLSSGVYFYELISGKFRDVKKMTLIK